MQKITKRQAKEIQALKRLRDEEIDLTDIPPLSYWNKAVIGKFYRPVKKSLTIRIDADVLAWLRGQGKGYQTRINALLREAMDGLGSSGIRIRLTEFGAWDRRKQIVGQQLWQSVERMDYCDYFKQAALLAKEPMTFREERGGLGSR